MRIMRDALSDDRATHGGIIIVVVDIHCLETRDLPLHVGGQGFVGQIHIREQCISALARKLDCIQRGRLNWPLYVALVGVEIHFSIRQSPMSCPSLRMLETSIT